MENHCISCGMPLNVQTDIGKEIDQGSLCKFCVNEDGSVKSCEKIFEGGIQFFSNSVPGVDRDLAERITRKNMNNQPYWQGANNQCLKGTEATDEEFQTVLNKLHHEQDQ